jgi:hypothetical protein
MKFSIVTALAVVALAGMSLQAEACNPLLSKNFGKRVPSTVLPAAMLATHQPATTARPSIVGLWHDVHTASDGSQFLEGFDTWNADGTENELGNLPPATGALCVGVWKLQGNIVTLTAHVAWLYDSSGTYQGTLDFTERNVVEPDGNHYFGSFDAKFTDPSGTLFQEVKGTTAAERLGR